MVVATMKLARNQAFRRICRILITGSTSKPSLLEGSPEHMRHWTLRNQLEAILCVRLSILQNIREAMRTSHKLYLGVKEGEAPREIAQLEQLLKLDGRACVCW